MYLIHVSHDVFVSIVTTKLDTLLTVKVSHSFPKCEGVHTKWEQFREYSVVMLFLANRHLLTQTMYENVKKPKLKQRTCSSFQSSKRTRRILANVRM